MAVIGSRAASDYGRRVAAMLAGELAGQGLTVVSGAAYGIDAAAHRGALRPAAGPRRCSAAASTWPTRAPTPICSGRSPARGCCFPNIPWAPGRRGSGFPARNRIISRLVQGVVVVEATEKSGSLITARLALDQGRRCSPCPAASIRRKARARRLIQQGARLVQTVQDILDELSWDHRLVASTPAQAALPGPALDPGALSLLDNLDTYARDIDTLVRRTGLPVGEIHALLLQLELCGLVRQLPGKLYERVSAA